MAIPAFQETMLPFIELFEKNKDDSLNMRDIIDQLWEYFKLNENEKKQLLPSGNDVIFDNRVRFARLYLIKAWLIESKERWLVNITDLWKDVLKNKPNSINLKYLEKYPQYIEFKNKLKKNQEDKKWNDSILHDNNTYESEEETSPIDLIESWFEKMNNTLKEDMKNKLKTVNPYYFEKIILKLLNKMWYWDFFETSKSWDWWIDWIINQDELWVDKIYIQCKRFDSNKVREPEIRNFIWAMSNEVNRWIFVTTSDFDEKAIEKAKMALNKIILINWDKLVELMVKFNIWIQEKNTYIIKEIDDDFFTE